MASELKNLDRHPLDPYLRIFACRSFLISVLIVAVSLGLFLSVSTNDWTWVNRFGAVVIVVGLLFTTSPIFVNGLYRSQSSAGRYASKAIDGTTVTTTADERKSGDNVGLGVVVTIIGTLANAFGDLLCGFVARL